MRKDFIPFTLSIILFRSLSFQRCLSSCSASLPPCSLHTQHNTHTHTPQQRHPHNEPTGKCKRTLKKYETKNAHFSKQRVYTCTVTTCTLTRRRYTITFSVKNKYFSLCFRSPFIPKWCKCILKTKTFESWSLSRDFKNGASENACLNSKNKYLNEYGGLHVCQTIVTWLMTIMWRVIGMNPDCSSRLSKLLLSRVEQSGCWCDPFLLRVQTNFFRPNQFQFYPSKPILSIQTNSFRPNQFFPSKPILSVQTNSFCPNQFFPSKLIVSVHTNSLHHTYSFRPNQFFLLLAVTRLGGIIT